MELTSDLIVTYVLLFFMLGGAFILGAFFGSRSDKKNKNIAVVVSPEEETVKADSYNYQKNNSSKRDEVSISDNPGQIRALRTRDRTGSLSQEGKREMIEQVLNFNRLGKGNPNEVDNFQKIVGIGPFVEEKLNEIGIYNYSQLANMNREDMDSITNLIDFFPGRIEKDDWKGQAQELMK